MKEKAICSDYRIEMTKYIRFLDIGLRGVSRNLQKFVVIKHFSYRYGVTITEVFLVRKNKRNEQKDEVITARAELALTLANCW